MPAPKMRTSADSSQSERASLQICCSASCAHGRARAEAQRLGLPACLATSNIKLSFLGSVLDGSAALLPKCERLEIARSQKELTWKAVVRLICPWKGSRRGTETGAAFLSCHLKLPTYIWGSMPGASAAALLPKGAHLQIAHRQKDLTWKAVAQPHLAVALLA